MRKHRLHRLKSQIRQIIILASCYLLLASLSYGQVVSSRELIENANDYNKKRVLFQGEVIGDIMKRGDFAWLNLWDGVYSIGVWAKSEIIPSIKMLGGYKRRGDLLEIKGIFYSSCQEHGGDLGIHADQIRVVREGFLIEEEISLKKKNLARNLFYFAFFLWLCIIMRGVSNKWKTR